MIEKRHLGFIGLGMMGGGMVKNLLKAGYSISVFDIDQAKMNFFKGLGASPVTSPKEVAEKNVKYLDAPVSGNLMMAEAGQLIVIVGGDRDAFDKCKEVLSVLGTSVHYAGSSGASNVVKLINNIMGIGNVLVAAEAFVLGVKAGVDGQTLFDIIQTCGGRSYHLEKGFPNVLARNFEPRFTLDLAKKDLGLAVDMAKNMIVPIPATNLIHQLYSISSSLGDGQKNFTAIIKLFESWAGVQVQGAKE